MKLVKLLVAVLVVVGLSVPTSAQTIPLEKTRKKPVGTYLLTFDLGDSPIGKTIDLPAWACGNITVVDYRDDLRHLRFRINIPRQFLPRGVNLAGEPWRLSPGQVVTIDLNTASFLLYWKYETVDEVRHIVVVIRRQCPSGGCKQLCDCK